MVWKQPGPGRPRGSINKLTIVKREAEAKIAAQTVADARRDGRKLAKEMLDDFMHLFQNVASAYQPALPGSKANPRADEDKFKEYARLCIECARALAPYQSPTFKAVAITTANTMPTDRDIGGDFIGNKPVKYPTLKDIQADLKARGLPPLRDVMDVVDDEIIEEINADDHTNGKVKAQD